MSLQVFHGSVYNFLHVEEQVQLGTDVFFTCQTNEELIVQFLLNSSNTSRDDPALWQTHCIFSYFFALKAIEWFTSSSRDSHVKQQFYIRTVKSSWCFQVQRGCTSKTTHQNRDEEPEPGNYKFKNQTFSPVSAAATDVLFQSAQHETAIQREDRDGSSEVAAAVKQDSVSAALCKCPHCEVTAGTPKLSCDLIKLLTPAQLEWRHHYATTFLRSYWNIKEHFEPHPPPPLATKHIHQIKVNISKLISLLFRSFNQEIKKQTQSQIHRHISWRIPRIIYRFELTSHEETHDAHGERHKHDDGQLQKHISK